MTLVIGNMTSLIFSSFSDNLLELFEENRDQYSESVGVVSEHRRYMQRS